MRLITRPIAFVRRLVDPRRAVPRLSRAARSERSTIGRGETALPVALHLPTRPVGTALVLHGRNGFGLTAVLAPATDAALARGLAVAVPELRHSDANDAPGGLSGFRMGRHVEDARRALDWLLDEAPLPAGVARAPVLVIGHSMGSYAALSLAAERGPDVVAGVVAVAPVVSGQALLDARGAMGPQALDALEAETPGAAADYAAHDVASFASEVVQPVGLIVGRDDGLTRPEAVARLPGMLPNVVAHDVMAGEDHCPCHRAYRAEVARQIDLVLAQASQWSRTA
ncbi:MAG: alpha/beta hydrolase [Paracoccaceae bacterium]